MKRISHIFDINIASTLNRIFGVLSAVLINLYIFILPYEQVLSVNGVSVLKIVGIALGLVVIIKLVVSRTIPKIDLISLFALIWSVLYAISGLYTVDWSWYLYYLEIYAANVLFFVVVNSSELSRGTHISMLLTSIFSSLFAGFISIVFNEKSIWITGRATIDIFGSNLDQNWFAATLSLGLFSCIYLFIVLRKKTKFSYLLAFPAILILYFVLATGSRMMIVAYCFAFVVCVVYLFFVSKKHKIVLISVAVLLALIPLLYLVLPEDLISRFSIGSILNFNEAGGRGEIWMSLLKYVLEKPIFGWGGGSSFYLTTLSLGEARAIHNSFLCAYFELGIIGLIPFFLIFVSAFYVSIKSRSSIALACIAALFVYASFLDTPATKMFWLYLLFIVSFSKLSYYSTFSNCCVVRERVSPL
jgi:O-antigen ligase